MNKLRLIKIYELRGKIHPIEQWVVNLLEGIEKKIYPEYILYYKDGIEYFYHNLNTNIIINYDCYINLNKYECSYEESDEIMKYLLEKHLKITINKVI